MFIEYIGSEEVYHPRALVCPGDDGVGAYYNGGMRLKAYVYCNKCDYKTKEYEAMFMAIAEVIRKGGRFTYKHNDDQCPKCKSLKSLRRKST